MHSLWLVQWLLPGAAIVLLIIVSIKDLSEKKWNRSVLVLLAVACVGVALAQKIHDFIKDSRAAEDFYAKERVREFRKETSQDAMCFFVDTQGHKCVSFRLECFPIPESVKLWEGGYDAPPTTLAVSNKTVTFLNSAFTNYEEYKSNPLLYQLKYHPKR